MTTPQELESKFWKALESDRVMMLGLEGPSELAPRPMTGLIENDHGPIWFFTARDNAIVALTRSSVIRNDAGSAVAWASSIKDPQLRASALPVALRRWQYQNPVAAAAALK